MLDTHSKLDTYSHRGVLIAESTLPGETRADGVTPAHPNGMQLSNDRFLILNATLGFLGVDNSRSTTWQLRHGGYDGPVIKEGFFCQAVHDWDPLDLGVTWAKETGAMTGFGVPKGAIINGRTPPHANRFVVKWRVCPRRYFASGPEGDYVKWYTASHEPYVRCYRTGWAQFQLTDDENDLIITETCDEMRQRGYEDKPFVGQFCEDPSIININQSYAAIWPYNRDHTEWVDISHSGWIGGGGTLRTLLYRFNTKLDRYEWVRTGRPMGGNTFEASIVPWGEDWVILTRRQGVHKGVAWTRVSDPFSEPPKWTYRDDIGATSTPAAAFACPDGTIRLLTGDGFRSPHAEDPPRWRDHRNPLYLFTVDPDDEFRMTDCRTVFDIVAAGLPIPDEHARVVDMGKILPHVGGREQTVVYRVRSSSMIRWEPEVEQRLNQHVHRMTPEIMNACAIYYGTMRYKEDQPPMWTF